MNDQPPLLFSSVRTQDSSIRASLAARITALTHSVDRLEQLQDVIPVYKDSLQAEIDEIHSVIYGLNELYEAVQKAELDISDSLPPRSVRG